MRGKTLNPDRMKKRLLKILKPESGSDHKSVGSDTPEKAEIPPEYESEKILPKHSEGNSSGDSDKAPEEIPPPKLVNALEEIPPPKLVEILPLKLGEEGSVGAVKTPEEIPPPKLENESSAGAVKTPDEIPPPKLGNESSAAAVKTPTEIPSSKGDEELLHSPSGQNGDCGNPQNEKKGGEETVEKKNSEQPPESGTESEIPMQHLSEIYEGNLEHSESPGIESPEVHWVGIDGPPELLPGVSSDILVGSNSPEELPQEHLNEEQIREIVTVFKKKKPLLLEQINAQPESLGKKSGANEFTKAKILYSYSSKIREPTNEDLVRTNEILSSVTAAAAAAPQSPTTASFAPQTILPHLSELLGQSNIQMVIRDDPESLEEATLSLNMLALGLLTEDPPELMELYIPEKSLNDASPEYMSQIKGLLEVSLQEVGGWPEPPQILIVDIKQGSLRVVFEIIDSFNAVKEKLVFPVGTTLDHIKAKINEKAVQLGLKKQGKDWESKLVVHPLLDTFTINLNYFNPEGNKSYEDLSLDNPNESYRGGAIYYPPIGWKRYGLMVAKNESMSRGRGSWMVAYRGSAATKQSIVKQIQQYSPLQHLSTAPKITADLTNTLYKGKKCCRGETIKNGFYFYLKITEVEKTLKVIQAGGSQYLLAFQCRVKPEDVWVPLSNPSVLILQEGKTDAYSFYCYGILVKKL
jgi:hypothetical protein